MGAFLCVSVVLVERLPMVVHCASLDFSPARSFGPLPYFNDLYGTRQSIHFFDGAATLTLRADVNFKASAQRTTVTMT